MQPVVILNSLTEANVPEAMVLPVGTPLPPQHLPSSSVDPPLPALETLTSLFVLSPHHHSMGGFLLGHH